MDDETTDCAPEEISAAVEGYIAVTFDVLGDSNNETISKMVSQEIKIQIISFHLREVHSFTLKFSKVVKFLKSY